MLQFLDTDGEPLSTERINGVPGRPGQPMPVKFECRSGYYLWAAPASGVTAEARLQGDTDWINVADSPIDLTPYAPDTTAFELRVTPSVAGVTDNDFIVSENPE